MIACSNKKFGFTYRSSIYLRATNTALNLFNLLNRVNAFVVVKNISNREIGDYLK